VGFTFEIMSISRPRKPELVPGWQVARGAPWKRRRSWIHGGKRLPSTQRSGAGTVYPARHLGITADQVRRDGFCFPFWRLCQPSPNPPCFASFRKPLAFLMAGCVSAMQRAPPDRIVCLRTTSCCSVESRLNRLPRRFSSVGDWFRPGRHERRRLPAPVQFAKCSESRSSGTAGPCARACTYGLLLDASKMLPPRPGDKSSRSAYGDGSPDFGFESCIRLTREEDTHQTAPDVVNATHSAATSNRVAACMSCRCHIRCGIPD